MRTEITLGPVRCTKCNNNNNIVITSTDMNKIADAQDLDVAGEWFNHTLMKHCQDVHNGIWDKDTFVHELVQRFQGDEK